MAPDRITSFARDGLRFDVVDSGPVDGTPVVLLHGFPSSASSWDAVAPLLHDAGLRTYAPLQRGYSAGARPRGRRAYRVNALTADVVALMDAIGRPVHVVGHDWGAIVGWSLAASRPERVASLTAVSVPHPAAMLGAARHGQAIASWYIGFFQLPIVPELILGSRRLGPLILERAGMTEAQIATFRRDIVESGALPGGLGWYRALPFGWDDTRARPPHRVTVPTTMVWSDRDGFLVRHGAEHTGDFVDAPYRLEILPGVTHWIPEQQPDRLARVILDQVGEPAP